MANGTIAFDTLTTSDSVNTGTEKSIDTSYIFNGVAKVWINFDGTGTPAARDSFNVTSITDNGTGSYDIVFTNSMSSANYTSQCSLNNGTTDVSGAHDYGWAIVDRTTADFRWDTENASNSQVDLALLDALVLGDLA
jgi:hypothetical protein|tara:strand:- start:281 stop:691 length:411 start_codon:yes stop_codon:yes gene_type:complete